MYEEIKQQTEAALVALLDKAKLDRGDLLVIGCSTSEIAGGVIGKMSTPQAAQAVFDAAAPLLSERGVFLAAQCCEHLNRTLIVERAYADAHGLCRVNVVPKPDAGGAFAAYVYEKLTAPVAVQSVRAQAGMDIGDTLIGMHLCPVAVPVRTDIDAIGAAHLVLARTRAPYVGGKRAHYDEALS